MTANLIARVVESMYQKINIDELMSETQGVKMRDDSYNITAEFQRCQLKMSIGKTSQHPYNRWLASCSLLEEYLRQNPDTFVETELVYKWAKDTCDRRNHCKNLNRAWGTNF